MTTDTISQCEFCRYRLTAETVCKTIEQRDECGGWKSIQRRIKARGMRDGQM
jgi:hypothetical protein